MIKYIIILLVSFLLDGIIPNLIKIIPIFFVTGVVLGSFLNIDRKKYFIITILCSIIYDITYTSSFIINTIIILLIMIIINLFNNKKIWFSCVKYVLAITIYLLFINII